MDNAAILEGLDEELGNSFASAGSKKVPIVTCTVEGPPLTEADLAHYVERCGQLPATKSDEKDVQTLRAKHHQVARLLALGLPEGIVANLTGYTESWLTTLKNSPSMVELISHYRAPGDTAARIIAEKLRFLADLSLEKAIEAVQADEFDGNQLLAAIKLGADRSNNGPMSKVEVGVVHSLDEETVQKISETARKKNSSRIIDVEAVRLALPAPQGDEPDVDA